MSYFSTALQTVVDHSFGGKHSALSFAATLPGPEIGRLIREDTPLTPAKLVKLCSADALPLEDKRALCIAAVHDLVPDPHWSEMFGPASDPCGRLREAPPFSYQGTAPLPPRAAQVLEYLITRAERDPDVVQALELLGRFLELREPSDPPSS